MEERKEREIAKLVRVLNQIAYADRFSEWSGKSEELARFCASQYNHILERIGELEPSIVGLFMEIPETSSPHVVRMAARELAGYFEEEAAPQRWGHRRHSHCGSKRVAFAWSPMFGGHCK
jgi:hypothetical protein